MENMIIGRNIVEYSQRIGHSRAIIGWKKDDLVLSIVIMNVAVKKKVNIADYVELINSVCSPIASTCERMMCTIDIELYFMFAWHT